MRLKTLSLFLAVFLVSLAGAATLQVMNLDDMSASSMAIVHGRITASRSDFSDSQRNYILTYYTMQADRYLKGNLGATFEFAEPGGRVGNAMTVVPGAPTFHAGDEVVLFVWTDSIHQRHQVIGFEQGAFRVQRDAATGRRVLSHAQPLTGGGQIVESSELNTIPGARTSLDLNEFLNQVTTSVRRVAARQQAQGGKQ